MGHLCHGPALSRSLVTWPLCTVHLPYGRREWGRFLSREPSGEGRLGSRYHKIFPGFLVKCSLLLTTEYWFYSIIYFLYLFAYMSVFSFASIDVYNTCHVTLFILYVFRHSLDTYMSSTITKDMVINKHSSWSRAAYILKFLFPYMILVRHRSLEEL